MSASYGWRPVAPPTDETIGLMLADLIGERLGISRIDLTGTRLNRTHLAWLEGVAAGASGELAEDARGLISAIQQYDTIEMIVSY